MEGQDERDDQAQDVEIIDLTNLSLSSSKSSTRESSRELSEDASMPWYLDPNGSHPFSLSTKSRAPQASAAPFSKVEFFPWGETLLEDLWNGNFYMEEDDHRSTWLHIISKWKNTAVVCGGRVVRVINTLQRQQGSPLLQVNLPAKCRFSIAHAKWALNPRDLHPLLIYVHSSVLHVFDAEAQSFLGCIRGHGGEITSLGVHPMHPHIVYTTSRDCTTRIYDLRIVTGPESSQDRRKSVFGIRIENAEGNCSIGKCVIVLTGGRSGGHEAAVLGADFHSSLPLIATCGMDHAVRIWHLEPNLFVKDGWQFHSTQSVHREDKPLFSSTALHDARVLSVHWLSHDLLMSQSAPRIVRINGEPVEGHFGTLAVWLWLSMGRFFPPDTPIYQDPPLRGCISDYRESSSYKVISLSRLPVDASRISVQHHHQRCPPIVLIPVRSKIVFLNASHLAPRNRPVLPDERARGDGGEDRAAKRIRLSEVRHEDRHTDVEGWTLGSAVGEDLEDEELAACAMSSDGGRIAAVGGREGVWIWNIR